jgi:predicted lipoprotein with Yx(FWY)xxD motif
VFVVALDVNFSNTGKGRMMRMRRLIAVAACAAVPAGCGDDSADTADRPPAEATGASQPAETSQPAQTTEPAEPAARRRGPLAKLRDSQLGPVMFNGREQAAYFFTRDRGGKSRCYGECAVAWPPFYARGKPRAGRGVKQSLLGTVARRDGRRQVTYAGKPLYFYAHDPKGQVLCNDIPEFGGTWFAVTAAGKAPA